MFQDGQLEIRQSLTRRIALSMVKPYASFAGIARNAFVLIVWSSVGACIMDMMW